MTDEIRVPYPLEPSLRNKVFGLELERDALQAANARLRDALVERDAMLALVATKSSLLCAWHAHYGAFGSNPHVIHSDLCACDVGVKKLRAHAARDARAALDGKAGGGE